ncbi:MAG: UDP-N-acetylmuramate--L-alanine ligase [Cyclobacteriaceae bacterium]
MNLTSLHSVYFLGIGGIGMSAIARWFNHIGIKVSGYDKTPSPLTEALENEGMYIHFEDNMELIPKDFLLNKANKLVVWTPAIPKDSQLLRYFSDQGFILKKRSEVLGIITRDMETVAVAGTHGKTTTSSMIAHLLKNAGRNTAAFLGGLTQNYESNLILHDEGSKAPPIVVVEADEFDRSFLQLHPNISVVTSIDPDHLDIYGDADQLLEGFKSFLHLTHADGRILINRTAFDKVKDTSFKTASLKEYGLKRGEIHGENIKPGRTSFLFDYVSLDDRINNLELKVPGFHNIENAIAAISVARYYGIHEEEIRKGISSYKGVKRRFEIIFQNEDLTYIDDYAHHPEEIKAFLQSIKAMFPGKKVTAIFQPHLFSRTRDFAEGFSESLSLADEVLLMEIYPAREKPIEGVTSSMLLQDMKIQNKHVLEKEAILPYLGKNRPEILVTIGAGDIDRMVPLIAKWIKDGKG